MASQSITAILGKAYMNGEKHIPFHRIVYANGKVWTSDTYDIERLKLYKKEGIEIDANGKVKDFKEVLFSFT
jgi:alkylated DNA nucleotide flippase Atl1